LDERIGGWFLHHSSLPIFQLIKNNYFGEFMQKGTVKMWDAHKGFGFIVTDDDDEVFVNVNDLHITIKNKRLIEGQRVAFDVKTDMKGDKAVNVRVV
jgi:cold shock protein